MCLIWYVGMPDVTANYERLSDLNSFNWGIFEYVQNGFSSLNFHKLDIIISCHPDIFFPLYQLLICSDILYKFSNIWRGLYFLGLGHLKTKPTL